MHSPNFNARLCLCRTTLITKKTKIPHESTNSLTQPIYGKNHQMLSEKAPDEKLDDNNQKRLQKIVGKFLYYARAVYPTMLMALKPLAEMHTKPKIETAKKVTQFLNYSETHTYTSTEYMRSRMILHIYSDSSYISEPEAKSRAGGHFLPGPKFNAPIQLIPP